MSDRKSGLTVAEGISGLLRGDPRLIEIEDCLDALHCGAPPSVKVEASTRLRRILASFPPFRTADVGR